MVLKFYIIFRSGLFQTLYTNMNYGNNDLDVCVINLLNECILLRDHQYHILIWIILR